MNPITTPLKDAPAISHANFMDFFNTIPALLFILDQEAKILHVNQTVLNRLGYTLEELVGQSVLIVHPKDRADEAWQNAVEMLAGQREFCPIPLQTKSGALIAVETQVCPGTWDGSEVLYGVSKDISDLQLSEEKFAKVFNITPALLAISSSEDDFLIDVNQAFCKLVGLKKEQILGRKTAELGMLLNPGDRAKVLTQMRTKTRIENLEVQVKDKNGRIHTGLFNAEEVYIGAKKCLLTTMTDITPTKQMHEQLRQYSVALEELVDQKVAKIEHISRHDEQTGLPNETAFRLRCEPKEPELYNLGNRAIILVMIDEYKRIISEIPLRDRNLIVKELAERINAVFGRWGQVYRIDTDQFAVVIQKGDAEFIMDKASQVKREIARQIILNGRPIFLTASIGLSVGELEDSMGKTLCQAEEALYFSQKKGNTLTRFSDEMDSGKRREKTIEEDMHSALSNGQMTLYYQPILRASTGTVGHVEILLRWSHPLLGEIPPAEFIPIAERSRLIIPITDWIVAEVCKKLAEWQTQELEPVSVSVNLCALSLINRATHFKESVMECIQTYGVDPSKLIFEITERTVLEDRHNIEEVLRDMKHCGIKFALDDFGTGYASFGLLKELPLDYVKLDRSLLENYAFCAKTRAIVRAMVNVAHELGMETITEGIEDEEQYRFIKACGSDFAQGYFFGKPQPVAGLRDGIAAFAKPGFSG